MKVAILGGTGPFGRGLATRLVAENVEVVIGSRDEQRAQSAAQEIGCSGARNEAAVAGMDIVVLAVVADAVIATAESIRDALESPVLSVASELEFGGGAAQPGAAAQSLAERTAQLLAVPVVAGRAIDVGPLRVARALEGMTAAIVNVNRRYKAHAGLRLTGLG